MMTSPVESYLNGPISYENWHAASQRKGRVGGSEVPIFTDAIITGEIDSGLGPYELLNTVAHITPDSGAPAIVLRAWYHFEGTSPEWEKGTNVDRFHGGGLADEIAALVSLCMGIRTKAGGDTRTFRHGGDTLGHPYYPHGVIVRDLPRTLPRPMIPRCSGQFNLKSGCALLPKFFALQPKAANVLVRASRLYQEAIWVCETAPGSSWLMLVSAIETVASVWRQNQDDPVQRLDASRPKLLELLRSKGDEEWVKGIAEQLAPYMGATKKFIDFLLEFMPEPPSARDGFGTHPWDKASLKRSFATIYNWRSKALHGGTPFPLPMCDPPIPVRGATPEQPTGMATAAKGGVWIAEDTPMLLHLFEHISRGALLNWWKAQPS